MWFDADDSKPRGRRAQSRGPPGKARTGMHASTAAAPPAPASLRVPATRNAPPLESSQPAAPAVGAVRSAVASGLRDAGEGYAQATDMVGVQVDKFYIHPVEAVNATGKVLGKATEKVPVVGSAVRRVGTVATFLTAFHGMIVGGIIRAPGDVVRDITHAAADQIDGRDTFDGDFGFGIVVPPNPKASAAAGAAAVQPAAR